MTMIGQATQPLELRYHRLETFNRWLLALAVVALVALAGLGIWTAVDRSAPSVDGEEVVTGFLAVWNGRDPQALASVYADDAVLVDYAGSEYRGTASIRGVFAVMAANEFAPEQIGPIVQNDKTLAVPMHLTWSDGSEMWTMTVLTLNDEGLIVRHQDYGGGRD
jgi:hypothetical protein